MASDDYVNAFDVANDHYVTNDNMIKDITAEIARE